MNFLKKKEYVYLIVQEDVKNINEDSKLKNKVFLNIQKELGSFFINKKVEFVDYFHKSGETPSNLYTILCTFDPKVNFFRPLLYEIYAFTELKDDSKFSFAFTKKEYTNENGFINVYKFKFKI